MQVGTGPPSGCDDLFLMGQQALGGCGHEPAAAPAEHAERVEVDDLARHRRQPVSSGPSVSRFQDRSEARVRCGTWWPCVCDRRVRTPASSSRCHRARTARSDARSRVRHTDRVTGRSSPGSGRRAAQPASLMSWRPGQCIPAGGSGTMTGWGAMKCKVWSFRRTTRAGGVRRPWDAPWSPTRCSPRTRSAPGRPSRRRPGGRTTWCTSDGWSRPDWTRQRQRSTSPGAGSSHCTSGCGSPVRTGRSGDSTSGTARPHRLECRQGRRGRRGRRQRETRRRAGAALPRGAAAGHRDPAPARGLGQGRDHRADRRRRDRPGARQPGLAAARGTHGRGARRGC